MRVRSTVLACVVGFGATWMWAGSASALAIGPIAVPPKIEVGPVVVDSPSGPSVLPKASVTASPTTGVRVGVSLPPALGAVPLLSALPHSINVAVGTDGGVSVSPVTGASFAPGSGTATPSSTDHARASSSAARTAGSSSSTVSEQNGVARVSTSRARHLVAVAPTMNEDTSAAVNASLRVPAPGGTWNLLREATSSRSLWLALMMIGLVACWAVRGFLRDALRRDRLVSSV
jgi:hypothetical protein